MRNRLIEIYHKVEIAYLDYMIKFAERAINNDIEDEIQHRQEFFVDKLLENGVIVPPCKVGDIVYPLNADRRFRAIIEKIEINANGLLFGWVQYDVGVDCTECWDEDLFTVDDIGKTVFLDETEYLIALKEREQV